MRRLHPPMQEPFSCLPSPPRAQDAPEITHSPAKRPVAPPNFRICEGSGRYVTRRPLTEDQIVRAAKRLLERRLLKDRPRLASPTMAADFLIVALAGRDREVFGCLLLDSQHRPLCFEELFWGTIDGAQVHPREVVKSALAHGAGAAILAHNHPSGLLNPSAADRRLTEGLTAALGLIGVRVLDHFIVGGGKAFSFAQHGLMEDAEEGRGHG